MEAYVSYKHVESEGVLAISFPRIILSNPLKYIRRFLCISHLFHFLYFLLNTYLIFDFICVTLSLANTHGIAKYARTFIRRYTHTHTNKQNKISSVEKEKRKTRKGGKKRSGVSGKKERKEKKKDEKKRAKMEPKKRKMREIRGGRKKRKKKEGGGWV